MTEETQPLKHGIIKWFDDKKGYGFIIPYFENGDVFVHKTLLHRYGIRPAQFTKVKYRDCDTKNGSFATYVEAVPGA
jgi:cold shock CspA family protein